MDIVGDGGGVCLVVYGVEDRDQVKPVTDVQSCGVTGFEPDVVQSQPGSFGVMSVGFRMVPPEYCSPDEREREPVDLNSDGLGPFTGGRSGGKLE